MVAENTTDPTEVVIAALDRLQCKPRRMREGYRALCPAHRDVRPSLSITSSDDRVLLHCFAGCRFDDLVLQLGIAKRELFSPSSRTATRPLGRRRVVAVYPYEDVDGRLVAEKVRFEPKSFAWRRPGP